MVKRIGRCKLIYPEEIMIIHYPVRPKSLPEWKYCLQKIQLHKP